MPNYLSAAAGAVIVLVLMLELLRRRQLREKYAVLWLCVGTVLLAVVAAPGLLTTVLSAVGFEVPANFLFTMTTLLLLGVCVHLSWEVSRNEDETRSLAEEVALLRLSLEQRDDDARIRGRALPDHPSASTDRRRVIRAGRPGTAGWTDGPRRRGRGVALWWRIATSTDTASSDDFRVSALSSNGLHSSRGAVVRGAGDLVIECIAHVFRQLERVLHG